MVSCQTCTAHYRMVSYYGRAPKMYNVTINQVFRGKKPTQPNGLTVIIVYNSANKACIIQGQCISCLKAKIILVKPVCHLVFKK